jgi:hypothetical protein
MTDVATPTIPELDDMAALWHLIARGTSGHADYVRAVRDDRYDAARAYAYNDVDGFRYWGARGLACWLMQERGYGYNGSMEQFDECRRDAAVIMGVTA